MSECAYCEKTEAEARCFAECDQCHVMTCNEHHEHLTDAFGDEFIACNPVRRTHPQGGCYRPPISEVRDDGDKRR